MPANREFLRGCNNLGIASDFVLIIIAGLAAGLAARALRLPLMVGYVAAAVLAGPNTAGPALELSFRDLQPVRRVALI